MHRRAQKSLSKRPVFNFWSASFSFLTPQETFSLHFPGHLQELSGSIFLWSLSNTTTLLTLLKKMMCHHIQTKQVVIIILVGSLAYLLWSYSLICLRITRFPAQVFILLHTNLPQHRRLLLLAILLYGKPFICAYHSDCFITANFSFLKRLWIGMEKTMCYVIPLITHTETKDLFYFGSLFSVSYSVNYLALIMLITDWMFPVLVKILL